MLLLLLYSTMGQCFVITDIAVGWGFVVFRELFTFTYIYSLRDSFCLLICCCCFFAFSLLFVLHCCCGCCGPPLLLLLLLFVGKNQPNLINQMFNFLFALSLFSCVYCVFNHPQWKKAIVYAKYQAIIILGEINFTPFRLLGMFVQQPQNKLTKLKKKKNKSKNSGKLKMLIDLEFQTLSTIKIIPFEVLFSVDRLLLLFKTKMRTCVKLCQALEFFNVKKFYRLRTSGVFDV